MRKIFEDKNFSIFYHRDGSIMVQRKDKSKTTIKIVPYNGFIVDGTCMSIVSKNMQNIFRQDPINPHVVDIWSEKN